ncbi:hypothetical protein HMPREF1493_1319 [Atopobium sp. ICM42b]|nr:hypothetical protein HMPREF1493_1319 [Atopobium sp. ICM42b]
MARRSFFGEKTISFARLYELLASLIAYRKMTYSESRIKSD